MKIPKTVRKYCPVCNAYTQHTVILVKTSRKRTGLVWGARKAREGKKGKGNKGKYSKRPLSQRKRGVFKIAKGVDIRLKCEQCGRQHIMTISGRYKRVEFSARIR